MPVDVYVPGCPPRPDAFMEGLLLLREQIGQERRPLNWVVGSQGIVKPLETSLKESKRDERMRMTSLRSPDEI
jgi:NADH-quinone oxidoreductase subunit B